MKKDFDILELISDDRKLKNFSNEELVDLKQKYPYSNIIELAINRNQFLNSGNLSLVQITDFIRKTDNPGNAFVAVVRDEVEKTKVKSIKSKVKNTKAIVKSAEDEGDVEKVKVKSTNTKVESTKLGQSRNPKLDSGTKVETKSKTRTRFLKKNAESDIKGSNKNKENSKTLKKVKEDEKNRVISDLSQGIASEQLANIYLKQGMKEEAIEMYRRLSLQNSEKSVYFAEILKKLINK